MTNLRQFEVPDNSSLSMLSKIINNTITYTKGITTHQLDR